MKLIKFLRQKVTKNTKKYKCTDCGKVNYFIDNKKITVGLCWNCEHPVWN